MRAIKSRPKFHCDFCSHVSTEAAMEKHERICWLNPNRYCASCENSGVYPGENGLPDEPCYYCRQIKEELIAIKVLGDSYFA